MLKLSSVGLLSSVAAALIATAAPALAQSKLQAMPGYEQWAKMAPQIPAAVKLGSINAEWALDSKSFDYMLDGKRWRFDLATRKAIESTDAPQAETATAHPPTGTVLARGRGREADVTSPDGTLRAISRDYNIWIIPTDGGPEKQVTTDGSQAARIRNGVGSYIYLEEFNVSQPVWWSPDGKKLAFMRYDETQVDDYYLQLDQTKMFSTMLTQAYPYPGKTNPVADLMVYDVATGATTKMDVREGKPFANDVVGHYAWAAQWTKDGGEVLIRRADRLQKNLDVAACSVATGACRSVVRESRPGSWASASAPRFLDDGKRFVWTSERNDFRNFYLYDLSGKQLVQLTQHKFDVVDIVHIDEPAGWLWYTARSGDNHMLVQLHRVKLNGKNDTLLTDRAFTHRVDVSPDGKYFVDVEQTHDKPPVSRLRDFNGRLVADITSSNLAVFDVLGLKKTELFTYTSADGKTQLHGQLQFPSNFDPAKKYPMLVFVYGGPASNGLTEAFVNANPLAEFGFLMLKLDARTNTGRGRKVLDTTYQQLGIFEIDDFAAGIRSLWSRPYVDRERVGMYGTSYGGTASAATLLRHPDAVQAASASSSVTDWRLYDTAYVERHMGLPADSVAAYDQASLLLLADALKGDLMLYYGTSDDNVHPNNTMQLIQALQNANKSFEVQVGPDRGHTGIPQQRMMEFFIERLILDRPSQTGRQGVTGFGPSADPG
jgi:dipeptidyl-peptidase-4